MLFALFSLRLVFILFGVTWQALIDICSWIPLVQLSLLEVMCLKPGFGTEFPSKNRYLKRVG